jgi:hypothetical protein
MSRTLAEIRDLKAQLIEEEKKALKAEKAAVVKQMKQDIIDFGITKGDLRGEPMKQILGKDYSKVYPSK